MEPLPTTAGHATCGRCGAAVEATWTFCGACGAPVAAVEQPSAVVVPIAPHVSLGPPVAPVARRPGVNRWVWSGVAVVLALLAGALVKTDLGTRHDRDVTRSRLVAEQARTADLTKQLKATSATLDETKTSLTKVQRERDDAATQLASVTAQLNGVRNSLNQAQSQLDLQAGEISTLKTCLNGVASALDYVGQEDYAAAGAALDAVQYSCEEASALF